MTLRRQPRFGLGRAGFVSCCWSSATRAGLRDFLLFGRRRLDAEPVEDRHGVGCLESGCRRGFWNGAVPFNQEPREFLGAFDVHGRIVIRPPAITTLQSSWKA